MAIINNITEVLHRLRVKLYPNYLPNVEGAYIARTDSEASLNIEQVCAALKNRGGFSGDYEDLVENVKQFFDEAAYQLCDGFAVNTGYYSIHPNVGGTFNNTSEIHDHKKHPITFRFRTGNKLRRLIEHIAENTSSKIIGIVPALPSPGTYRVVIVTQFSSGSTMLKEPRTIICGFTLNVE
jgi:hypothetical protein